MGLFDFVKDAGAKVFGGGGSTAEPVQRDLDQVLADKRQGATLRQLVTDMGLPIEDLQIKFRDGLATLEGRAGSQVIREKVVLLVGNVQGVARVDDQMTVEASAPTEPAATFYTVQAGDTLSKIAKQHYGNANAYMKIFEANRPMLANPDKIYPGQVLRIPS